MDKPFITIDEQVKKLRSRGLIVADSAKYVLMRESYYAIINGYKEPFINRELSGKANDDRYMAGTTFDDIYSLFTFDRKLRNLTFEYVIQAEAVLKTAVIYVFSEHHRDDNAFLNKDNFCLKKEYYNPNKYNDELENLIKVLKHKVEEGKTDYIKYYRSHHDCIPLWVISNNMTFGNIIHFFELMKTKERIKVAKMVTEAVGRLGNTHCKYFGEVQIRKSSETLNKFRNACAHDERLYSMRVGITPVSYSQMIWLLEHYLISTEFNAFIDKLQNLVSQYKQQESIRKVLVKAGINDFTNDGVTIKTNK